MKSTGIVRKIDDLGRIVIPKEIRKNLRIRVGDPLEIYIEKDGKVILEKYNPMGNIAEISKDYADALAKTTGYGVIVTGTEKVIAAVGTGKLEYLNKDISEDINKVMDDRVIWTTKHYTPIRIIEGDVKSRYVSQIIAPIISDGDAIGTVIIFSTESRKVMTEVEYKLVQSATMFLSKQME